MRSDTPEVLRAAQSAQPEFDKMGEPAAIDGMANDDREPGMSTKRDGQRRSSQLQL